MGKSNSQKLKPIIYSCSGCSNVAQLANDIAVKVDDENIAEMSCIVGVGGKVKPLVKKAQSGRPIIVIDGCPLKCGLACLENVDIEPNMHITLTEYNIKKSNNSKLNLDEFQWLYSGIINRIENISNHDGRTNDKVLDK